jgi:hypothetical protein
MIFNPKTMQLEGEIEHIPKDTVKRIMNRVVWGNPEGKLAPQKPHLSDIVDLSPNDPVFRGEPYINPDNTPH